MWCLQACFLVAVWESIDMWKDPWIPWLDGFIPIHRDPSSTNYPQLVSSLIDSSNKTWKIDLLLELVDSTSKEAILKITIPSAPSGVDLVNLVISPSLCSHDLAKSKLIREQSSIQIALSWSSPQPIQHSSLLLLEIPLVSALIVGLRDLPSLTPALLKLLPLLRPSNLLKPRVMLRNANMVAHFLAKFASSQSSYFYCNSSNLPPLIHEA
uniref:Uncharacterized protein n=1 Tax=Fagus sylvatica TaxID=28930 RepID=A0A2N9EM10_FAGSY